MDDENGSSDEAVADGGRDADASSDAERSARWRCEWCGKPHDRNDPPCDNCGHHKFERAVVPVAPESTDHQPEPIWVCPECGRQHQKNSPPCSRCGNAQLEKRYPDEEDFSDELGGTSYLDLLEPQYVAGFALAIVGAAVLVLALLGVVTLPGMDGGDLTVENVPGSAESANGVDLAAAEDAYLDAIGDRRADAGQQELSRTDRLDDVATFANQRWVKSVYGEGERASNDRLRDAIGDTCGNSRITYLPLAEQVDSGAFTSADALGSALADAADADSRDTSPVDVEGSITGADVHVGPDDRVFLTQFVC